MEGLTVLLLLVSPLPDEAADSGTDADVYLVHQVMVFNRFARPCRDVAPLRFSRRSGTLWLFAITLLSGDIHTNPGLFQYPCGICKKWVASNQKGLLCDLCNNWCHIACVDVTADLYERFCGMDNFDWQCFVCLFSHLPSLAISSDNDSKSSDNDSSLNDHYPLPIDAFTPPFTNLRIVHQNVQGLLSKMTEISEWLYESFNMPLILCCSETWLLLFPL